MTTVAIGDSGVANLASIQSAFRALDVVPLVTSDPEVFRSASFGVVPGVGAFGAGMGALRNAGLDTAIIARAEAGAPLLAVCLGMQMLGAGSEEDPGVAGLGIVDGVFERLQPGASIPHLGWNRVEAGPGTRLLSSGDAAFANTYCLPEVPAGWAGASTVHGGTFVSAIERGRILATQFHPELSGRFGMDLLRRWLADEPAAVPAGAAGRHTPRINPCLDVRDGRVVKGVKFQ